MSGKVKLGFIGSGGIVRGHMAQGLKDFDDVEFAGWCDLNPENAKARQEEVGGQGEIFTDAAEMLDTAKPDAVYIMLPPFAHGEAEKLVIDRKLPFFVEKPVAIDMPTAETVMEGAEKNGLITSVGYMTRYRDSVQKVKSLLEEQKPVMMHGGWLGAGPAEDSRIYNWWVSKDKSGGQLIEQATHTIDIMRFLFGDVTQVYSVPVNNRRKRPEIFTIEEATMTQLSFENGATANVYASCCTTMGGGVSLTVWGTDMRAEFSGWQNDVDIFLPDDEKISIPGEDNIFSREDRAFIDSVKAGENRGILATYEDGLKATAIACAADKSMATGEAVRL